MVKVEVKTGANVLGFLVDKLTGSGSKKFRAWQDWLTVLFQKIRLRKTRIITLCALERRSSSLINSLRNIMITERACKAWLLVNWGLR